MRRVCAVPTGSDDEQADDEGLPGVLDCCEWNAKYITNANLNVEPEICKFVLVSQSSADLRCSS